MAGTPIQPITVTPVGDDQPWKRDAARLMQQLIDRVAQLESAVDNLKAG